MTDLISPSSFFLQQNRFRLSHVLCNVACSHGALVCVVGVCFQKNFQLVWCREMMLIAANSLGFRRGSYGWNVSVYVGIGSCVWMFVCVCACVGAFLCKSIHACITVVNHFQKEIWCNIIYYNTNMANYMSINDCVFFVSCHSI